MSARKPVTPEDIDLRAGSASDARALSRYAQQLRAAAVPLLVRAVSSPSVRLRKAAFEALAVNDQAQAEGLALAAARGVENLKNKKARRAALEPLRIVATADCLDRLLELGEPVSSWDVSSSARVLWAPRRLAQLTEASQQVEFVLEWFGASALRDNNALVERVREMLAGPLSAGARVALARELVRSREGEVRDAAVIVALAIAEPQEDWAAVLTEALRDPPELGLALLRDFPAATVERAPADELFLFACEHGLLDVAAAAARRISEEDRRPYGPLRSVARSWRMRGLNELAERADRFVPGISSAP